MADTPRPEGAEPSGLSPRGTGAIIKCTLNDTKADKHNAYVTWVLGYGTPHHQVERQ
ncbi:hypothetical protein ACQP04_02445 [Pseudonocardia halophobica]|uniref:hypothetical protein n=1 Tax=Pseudonocardia halophobica TaxID=29401 RepID=UPI003D91C50F